MTHENLTQVEVGQHAPDFVAQDLSGSEVRLSTLIGGKRALLLFYRGGWCPYCNQQLAAIAGDYQKFQDLNTVVVAVSGEETLKGKELLQKIQLPFILLSDTTFRSIDMYGVRDNGVSDALKARGIGQLPKPSAFVIDAAGMVRFRYVGKNATDRPKNDDLLQALKKAGAPWKSAEFVN